MKTITVNDMILNTLHTKNNKTPKYLSVLQEMGYEFTNESTYSYDNYWALLIPTPNENNYPKYVELCLSKSNSSKDRCNHIFLSWKLLKQNHGKPTMKDTEGKIDFVNLIKVLPVRWLEAYENSMKQSSSTNIVNRYYRVKADIRQAEYMLSYDKRHIGELEEKLRKLTEETNREIQFHKDSIPRHEESLRNARKELDKLFSRC